MKGKPIYYILQSIFISARYLLSCGRIIAENEQNRPYLSSRYISVRDIIFLQLISFKTIELDSVSIFFHEIFRINV